MTLTLKSATHGLDNHHGVHETRSSAHDVDHTITDGRSISGTASLVDNLGTRNASRIILKNAKDRNMYGAISKELAIATGDILVCLNSDEMQSPWSLIAVMHAFERNSSTKLYNSYQKRARANGTLRILHSKIRQLLLPLSDTATGKFFHV